MNGIALPETFVDVPLRPMSLEPATLEGRLVRLEPMRAEHVEALCVAGLHEEIWQWTLSYGGTPEAMQAYVQDALRLQREGSVLPFVTIHRPTGQVVGSTRFAHIDAQHHKLELGYTWITPAFQRTGVNTEAKYLQLRHAFEHMGVLRVEIHTDAMNERSRAAIERIGATFEGVLRNTFIARPHEGRARLRHTVVFSIIASDWPSVKANLEARLTTRGLEA